MYVELAQILLQGDKRMIRQTISATLFVDGTKRNTVPGLSKTVS